MLRLRSPMTALLPLLALLLCHSAAANAREPVYIKGLGIDGVNRDLDVSRYPALYTGDFDDCLGGESLFNVTKFDAAYYADNLTVLFHLDGTTNIHKENLIRMINLPSVRPHILHINSRLTLLSRHSSHLGRGIRGE